MINKFSKIVSIEQKVDGSFESYSANLKKWGDGKKTKTSFFASLILISLSSAFENKFDSNILLKKSCKFLLSQKSSNWTWNYWVKNSPEVKQFKVPNDLDDTFLAASALYLHKKLPPKAIINFINLLTIQEKKVGGPYKTWVVPNTFNKKWQDIDLAVNSNIAYFLSFYDIKLKSIENLVERAVKSNNYSSKYYPTIYPVLYFISRSYVGPNRNKIIDFIFSKRINNKWNNPQDTALALSALLNLGVSENKIKKEVRYLNSLKTKEIKAHPFCMDPSQKGEKYAAGSKALTAALIFETLNKYNQKKKPKNFDQVEQFYQTVFKQIQKEVTKLDSPTRHVITGWITQVLETDKTHKIILASYWASQNKNTKVVQLASLATFYGWMAYLLQDKMLDRDAGPELIPIANYFNRQLNSVVNQLEQKKFNANKLLDNLCQRMDNANNFELKHLTLRSSKIQPIYLPKIPKSYQHNKLLAEKSIGFAFGPALLFPKLEKFFHHYLIARQLNDDAHDWEEDLNNGRLNSVSIMLIKQWQKLHPTKMLTKSNIIINLKPLFWNSVIITVARQIKWHCNKAIKETNNFPALINPLTQAANQVITQKQHADALTKISK